MDIKIFQYLLNRKNEDGFTLIELIVVIIIIGILSAIAMPSLLSCGGMPVSLRGKYSVREMNRSQQAYFTENRKFSNSLAKLGTEISAETKYFNYSIITTQNSAFNYGVARNKYTDDWLNPKPIKTFVGAVFIIPITGKNKSETLAIICESKELTTNRPANPILKNGVPSCGEGTIDIEKNNN